MGLAYLSGCHLRGGRGGEGGCAGATVKLGGKRTFSAVESRRTRAGGAATRLGGGCGVTVGGTGARRGGREGDEGGRGWQERRRGEEEVLAGGQKPPEMNVPGGSWPQLCPWCWRTTGGCRQPLPGWEGGCTAWLAASAVCVPLPHPFGCVASGSWAACQCITVTAQPASPCGRGRRCTPPVQQV